MNLLKWNRIYENNKRLDLIFLNKYSFDKNLYEKNYIELLVEIGEFINETKIFKYWSVKKANKEKVLEEYADVITMLLTFCGYNNLELNDFKIEKTNNILKSIIELYQEVCNYSKDNIIDILKHVLIIGYSLDLNEEEIIEAINKKHKIIEERLNSDY